jgi:hypothetical protein
MPLKVATTYAAVSNSAGAPRPRPDKDAAHSGSGQRLDTPVCRRRVGGLMTRLLPAVLLAIGFQDHAAAFLQDLTTAEAELRLPDLSGKEQNLFQYRY